jgi:ribose transport system substrate-binding protein
MADNERRTTHRAMIRTAHQAGLVRRVTTVTKRLLIAGVLAVACTALSSCAKPGTGPAPARPRAQVAFVTNNVSDFWLIAKAGVNQADKDFDADCEFRMPAQGTATEQKSIVEDLIVKGVSGIAISPVDPANQTAMLDQAAAKVNLITHDSDAPQSKRLCYVGTNNYQAGLVAGKELMKVLPRGGKVMVFVGTLDAENAHDRNKGVADAVKGSKIQIVGTLTDNTDRTKAKANVEDTLIKYPDIAGLVGLWSYNGPAIAEAVRAAGKQDKVKIVCFDEDTSTLQAVKDGVIQATVVQKPYEFGYQSVKILAALARHEDAGIPKGKVIDTGVEVITKGNVDPFWAKLKEEVGKK